MPLPDTIKNQRPILFKNTQKSRYKTNIEHNEKRRHSSLKIVTVIYLMIKKILHCEDFNVNDNQ